MPSLQDEANDIDDLNLFDSTGASNLLVDVPPILAIAYQVAALRNLDLRASLTFRAPHLGNKTVGGARQKLAQRCL